MGADDIPVLIAGGGPVGLALAVELGRAGIDCLLVEKRDGSLGIPKMSGLSIRAMEFNRRWGIAGRCFGAGWPNAHPNDFVYCTSLTGYELARLKVPSVDTRGEIPFTPEGPCGCAQIFYDPILLETARSLPSVTIRHLVALERFEDTGDGVRCVLADQRTGDEETVTARYLVGCDGADGTVRRALGVRYEGIGKVSNSLNVYFRSAEMSRLHDFGWARFYRFIDEGGSWGEIIGIDGRERWRLSVFDTDAVDPSRATDPDYYLHRLAGCDFDYEILSSMPWQRTEQVAGRYRYGNVFIAGDAAHQNSPTGGLGLHTGLGDAVDLAWKLAATLQGWGGPDLLESYDAERRLVGYRNVVVSTEEYKLATALPGGPAIVEDSPAGEALRQRFKDAWNGSRQARSKVFTENLRLGYCYEDSPIIVPDGTAAPPLETPEFVPVARPGTRAPHGWIAPGRSTLDLFGGGFVLLRLGDAPPDVAALVESAKSRGVPIETVDIADPAIAGLYERRLVLVRPDGHVAWRADTVPRDACALIDRVRGAG